jgi:uronate dehydrogenase
MRPTSCAPPDAEDAISREFHGGPYTQMGFDGDLARIE